MYWLGFYDKMFLIAISGFTVMFMKDIIKHEILLMFLCLYFFSIISVFFADDIKDNGMKLFRVLPLLFFSIAYGIGFYFPWSFYYFAILISIIFISFLEENWEISDDEILQFYHIWFILSIILYGILKIGFKFKVSFVSCLSDFLLLYLPFFPLYLFLCNKYNGHLHKLETLWAKISPFRWRKRKKSSSDFDTTEMI